MKTPTAAAHTAHPGLITSRTTVRGSEFVAVTNTRTDAARLQRVEIYRVDPADGIEMFLGYYDDLATDPRVAECVQPLVLSHFAALDCYRNGWLPGEIGWRA